MTGREQRSTHWRPISRPTRRMAGWSSASDPPLPLPADRPLLSPVPGSILGAGRADATCAGKERPPHREGTGADGAIAKVVLLDHEDSQAGPVRLIRIGEH